MPEQCETNVHLRLLMPTTNPKKWANPTKILECNPKPLPVHYIPQYNWFSHPLHCICWICLCPPVHHLVYDAEDNRVDKADSSYSHQTQQEEVGITVQLEVGGFGIQDGAHQLTFGCAETWEEEEDFYKWNLLLMWESGVWKILKSHSQCTRRHLHQINLKTHLINTPTCADHHSLDHFTSVEAGLDDMGATEECMSLIVLCVVGTVSLPHHLFWGWVWEVGLCHRNALTWRRVDLYQDGF